MFYDSLSAQKRLPHQRKPQYIVFNGLVVAAAEYDNSGDDNDPAKAVIVKCSAKAVVHTVPPYIIGRAAPGGASR